MTKRKYYHVILMDYMMPEMDGLQTLKQLRKQENGLSTTETTSVTAALLVSVIYWVKLSEEISKVSANRPLSVLIYKYIKPISYHVIDSSQISCGQGLVVLYAARLALEGLSADIICNNIIFFN